MKPHEYSIIIRTIQDDAGACFEARVCELPDVAEYADTYAEAYELAVDTIETTAQVFAEYKRPMPKPFPCADGCICRLNQSKPQKKSRLAGSP